MHIANGFIAASGILWAGVALAHGPDGHEDHAGSGTVDVSTFVSWELLQAPALDARSAEKMAQALQGMSGPEAAWNTTYGMCVARMTGVIGDDSQTLLLHQPGENASYTAGAEVGSNRSVEVSLGATDGTATWSIDWKPEGEALVHREGEVASGQLEHLHVPMAGVVDGTLLLATVGVREQSRMFNPPYDTAKSLASATEACAALGTESSGKQKKAFKDWLKQVTSVD